MKGFKGFDKDLKCRGFQYEVGKKVELAADAKVELCRVGFHYCEYPLDVFNYYPPAGSRFAEVEAEGVAEAKDGDSKRAARGLLIKAELTLAAMVDAAVKFTFERADWSKKETQATGYQGAASATGDQGAASATGYQGAASATGVMGAASATGAEGVAVALGIEGRAKGAKGSWLTLAEWKQDDEFNWHRIDVKTARVDGRKIKADTFYQLVKGKFVEAA